ncbi:LLM class flavin-dependent oxidoreductase [Streptomyces sp. NPDC051001]|uniref:LLM class flavin-dependent oxidoreductase n=1 Tax=Streptomyces sp. NPDC051001 TaxID=3155795 RepID=UPI003423D7B4
MKVRDATADRRQVVWSGRGGTHAIDGPSYGTPPTLTHAALVTSRLEISTLVAGPNFRHPVSFSRDLIGLDEISEGRLTLGVGVGAESGYDVDAFGTGAPKSRGRAGPGRRAGVHRCRRPVATCAGSLLRASVDGRPDRRGRSSPVADFGRPLTVTNHPRRRRCGLAVAGSGASPRIRPGVPSRPASQQLEPSA